LNLTLEHMLPDLTPAAAVSEVCRLTWRIAIPNGKSGRLHFFGKGGRSGSAERGSWSAQALRPPSSQTICPDAHGQRRNAGARRGRSSPRPRAGLPNVSPHWFSHAHGSHARSRRPAYLVMETLGHADLQMTSEYAHARPTDSSARYLQSDWRRQPMFMLLALLAT
jgi:integrase/recombinase XerD